MWIAIIKVSPKETLEQSQSAEICYEISSLFFVKFDNYTASEPSELRVTSYKKHFRRLYFILLD